MNPVDDDLTLVPASREVARTGRKVAALVVLRGPDIGRQHQLRRHRVVLGRADEADILLRDRKISRAHAAIETSHANGQTSYRLIDLASRNHVYVNGVQTDSHALTDGDKIQVGEVLLKFELHDAIDSRFHSEVRSRIRYDDLTGLLTYEAFRGALDWELAGRAGGPRGCALLMMDLDDFKRLNDLHGHLTGSAVLQQVGALIRANMRQCDVAARYGGEEFVAYLPETTAGEARAAALRLRGVIAERVFERSGHEVRVTISIGVAHCPGDGFGAEALIGAADARLYQAKRGGKNCVIGAD